MFNLEETIRKIAKSNASQNLFLASKEINGVQLFQNTFNFSRIQKSYLNFLYTYHGIYQDIYLKKVSKKVLDSFIDEEAYLYYKNKADTEKKEEPIIDNSGKTKQPRLRAVFAKDKKLKFPKSKEVK